MVSVLSSSAVDRGFESQSGQTKDYEIGICCFFTKHAALTLSLPLTCIHAFIITLLIVLTDKSAVINSMLLSVTDISAVNKHMRNRNDGFFRSNG